MKIKVFAKNPAPRHIEQIVEVLKSGGIIVFPTDTVYSFGCDSGNPEAVKKLARLKDIPLEKANFSFLFSDLTALGEYAKHINNNVYKMMKRLLPGPFTFILPAHAQVSKIIPNKKTIGLRVPDNRLPQEIVRALGNPLLTTSVHDEDSILGFTTDPDLIAERHGALVDMVVDGGYGNNEPSTVVDCTGSEVLVIRQGLGELEEVFA